MLSFSAGCVINLEDLDDFPDYFQVITNVKDSFQQKNLDYKSLQVFLDADLEDIQHIPEFRQLMTLLIENQLVIFTKEKNAIKDKFVILLLRMIKSYFISFTIEDQQAGPMMDLLFQQLPSRPHLFCDFWLSISKFAPYVQNHKLLVDLYLKVVDEKQILKSEELSLAYLKSVDKVLRFHMFRSALQSLVELRQSQKETQYRSTPLLNFKISKYEDKVLYCKRFEELIKFGQQIECSNFLRDYIESKRFQSK